MFVQVNVSLSNDETAPGSASDIAANVLSAIGGDPEKDVVNVQIIDMGSAGQTTPMLPPSPPLPVSEPPSAP